MRYSLEQTPGPTSGSKWERQLKEQNAESSQWDKISIKPDGNISQSGLTSFWKRRRGAANILNIKDNEIQLFRFLSLCHRFLTVPPDYSSTVMVYIINSHFVE